MNVEAAEPFAGLVPQIALAAGCGGNGASSTPSSNQSYYEIMRI
jgi:hypothetical protein